MTDVSFMDLVVRMVFSLAIVLGLMFGAYSLLRRRQGFVPSRATSRTRSDRSVLGGSIIGRSTGGNGGRNSAGGSRVAGNRRGLRVLGRVGVGRTSQVVAVQFAERVYLVGASDTSAPSVLAELDLAAWTAATETPEEDLLPLVREPVDPRHARPANLLDSLREATTRRG